MTDETRKKVIDAARELGYRVNFLARSLQSQSSGLVGIVASRLDTPMRAAQVRMIAQELLGHGFTPILVSTEGQDDQTGLVERLLNYSVAGMIITSGTPPSSIIEECAQLHVPVVLINRDAGLTGADRNLIDVEASGRRAFDMLRRAGGDRCAVLQPADRTFSVLGRAEAFAACCRSEGFPVDVVPSQRQDYDAGVAASDHFVATSQANAVFCTTDLIALGFLDGLRQRHRVSVPESVQIVGFDDIPQAAWLAHNLSTISQPAEQVAADAVQLILHRISAPDRDHETRKIAIAPVYRGTTKKPQT
jgi:DNA-binding LacI/PurR family transcriptional regulator